MYYIDFKKCQCRMFLLINISPAHVEFKQCQCPLLNIRNGDVTLSILGTLETGKNPLEGLDDEGF